MKIIFIFFLIQSLLYWFNINSQFLLEMINKEIFIEINESYKQSNLYTIVLIIGGQNQSLIVDTGSPITTLSCYSKLVGKNIYNLGKNHYLPIYNSSLSEDSKLIKCNSKICRNLKSCKVRNKNNAFCYFETVYGEKSSVKGYLIKDSLKFKYYLDLKYNLFFGCIHDENSYIKEQKENGIFGLAYKVGSIENQLFKDYNISGFSLFLTNKDRGFLKLYQNRSVLSFEYDKCQNNEKFIRINIYQNYKIYISSLSLIDRKLRIKLINNTDELTAIIDSGSTISYFPQKVFLEFKELFIKEIHLKIVEKEIFEICYNFSDIKNIYIYFPILRVNMITLNENIFYEYNWYPEHYLFFLNNLVCLGINSYKENYITLGNSFMTDHEFIFDFNYNIMKILEVSENKSIYQCKNINNFLL